MKIKKDNQHSIEITNDKKQSFLMQFGGADFY